MQSNMSEFMNQMGPLTEALGQGQNNFMDDEEDDDYHDEDMDSEEEKDDRPSIGVVAHLENENALAGAPRTQAEQIMKQVEGGENDEQKKERLLKEGIEKKRKIGDLAKKLFQRLSIGCGRDICFSRFCRKNPKRKSTHLRNGVGRME